MDNDQSSIEEFRKIIRREFGEKGIYPPEVDGDEERQLYEKWVEGRKKLEEQAQDLQKPAD